MPTMLDTLKDKLGVLVITAVVSIAMVFSDRILESIKTAVNRSEQRPAQQEKLARDFSAYMFAAETSVDYLKAGLTTKAALVEAATAYKKSLATLRENEYVYYAVINQYWGKQQVGLYENFIANVRAVDRQIQKFSPQILQVLEGSKSTIDPQFAEPLTQEAMASLVQLQASAKQLLLALSVN